MSGWPSTLTLVQWCSGLYKRSSRGSDISCRIGGRPFWLLNLVQRPVCESHWTERKSLQLPILSCSYSGAERHLQGDCGFACQSLKLAFLLVLQLPVLGGTLEQLANHFNLFVLSFRWLETLRLLRATKPRSKDPWKFTPNTFSILICQGYFHIFPLVFYDQCRTWKCEEPFSTNEHSHGVLKVFGWTTHKGSGVVEKASQLLGIDPEVGDLIRCDQV